MRFFHLSDLHIGKHLHYYNLKEDQIAMLSQVVEAAKTYRPDAVVIAGDIYDKSVPSAEAVTIFNEFLTELSGITPSIPILMISGNHDSAERLEYASRILGRNQIYIAGIPPRTKEEYLRKVVLEDSYGRVCFYLLPFVKPGYVRNVVEEEVESYEDAITQLLAREKIDSSMRNVLVSHQFYTSGRKEPVRSDSEMISVGGLDNVEIQTADMFDYIALGHIHRAQKIGSEKARYCGTLLKYSVSESRDEKALQMVELKEKGSLPEITRIPLQPLRDVRKIQGTLEEILERAPKENQEDYVSVTLTDEVEPYQPREQLEEVYPRLLEVRLQNSAVGNLLEEPEETVDITNPANAFADFFREMQGREMTEEEQKIMDGIFREDVGEEEGI